MSLNQSFIYLFLISQNIHADLKGPKVNINCTMVDVRGDVLRPPHGTKPAAVKTNLFMSPEQRSILTLASDVFIHKIHK